MNQRTIGKFTLLFCAALIMGVVAGQWVTNASAKAASKIGAEQGVTYSARVLYVLSINGLQGNRIDVLEDISTGNLMYYTLGGSSTPISIIPYSQLSQKEIAKLHRLYDYVMPNN